MTYLEALQKIHFLDKFGCMPGLERITELLNKIDNPQDKLKFIHIAGTNGKGSVCTMISTILENSDYKVGLFISPYITDFRERIQINNQYIRESTFVKAVEKIFPIVEELSQKGLIITEFELVCAIAFDCFAHEKCSIVVLETGLGGNLDATNVIKQPLCSVFTKISLDHMNILGNTLEEIALDKSGIIKPDGITVIAEQDDIVMEILEEEAIKKNNGIVYADEIYLKPIYASLEKNIIEYRNQQIKLKLLGNHQLENVRVVISVINFLITYHELEVSFESLKYGLENTHHPGRLELINKNPVVVLDGAHNVGSMKVLCEFMNVNMHNKYNNICIFGMLQDKEVKLCVELLKDYFGTIFTVPIDNDRTMSEFDLADLCRPHFDSVIPSSDVESAFESACALALKEGQNMVICGSLYLISDIRPYILKKFKKYFN